MLNKYYWAIFYQYCNSDFKYCLCSKIQQNFLFNKIKSYTPYTTRQNSIIGTLLFAKKITHNKTGETIHLKAIFYFKCKSNVNK